MKIAKRDLALIMVIVGIIAAFCSYKFYFSGVLDDIDSEQSQQEVLEAKKIELEKKSKEVQNMEKEAKDWVDEINTVVEKYDPAYQYEDGIMWMKKLEDTFDDTYITSYTVGETGIDKVIAGQGDFNGKAYVAGATVYTYTYDIPNYAALKEFIAYIGASKEGVKTLNSMTFTQNGEGFTGSITMKAFALADGSKEYVDQNLSGVQVGIENIFPKVEVDKKDKEKKDNE